MKKIENKPFSYMLQTSPGGQTLQIKNEKTQKVANLVLSADNFKPSLTWVEKVWNATIGLVFSNYKWVAIHASDDKTFYIYQNAIRNLNFTSKT